MCWDKSNKNYKVQNLDPAFVLKGSVPQNIHDTIVKFCMASLNILKLLTPYCVHNYNLQEYRCMAT